MRITSIAGSNSTIRSSTSRPLSPGITRSVSTICGCSRNTISTPSSGSSAVKILRPGRVKAAESISRLPGLSSITTRETDVSALISAIFSQEAADGAPQLCHADRLTDVCGKAGRDRALTIAGHGAGRQRNDRDAAVPLLGTQALKNPKTVGMRHVKVENDEIGLRLERALNRLPPVARFDNHVPGGGKDGADQLTACVAVLGHQNRLRQ